MKKILLSLFLPLLIVSCETAKPAPQNNEATLIADSLGEPILMDFSIKLTGIKDADMPYSAFSQRPLLAYYFSPFCPHCQKGYGSIQQIAKEYEPKGLTSIAISVSNVSENDILEFMEEQNASILFFQDSEKSFGKKYGDGYVPRLYLIAPDGKVNRYKNMNEEHLKNIKTDIEKLLNTSK